MRQGRPDLSPFEPAPPARVPSRGRGPVRPLRVLVAHNRYQIPGGEDAVVDREVAALRAAGQVVETVFVHNDDIRTAADRLRTAWDAPRNPAGIAAVLEAARAFRPDVFHAHNTFPLLSPAVHGAVRRLGVATVQTLHNYRVGCAAGVLLRDGKPCELCLEGSPYQAVRFGCYRGSRLGSAAVARLIDTHRRAGTWTRDVDRIVALSDFARDRFVAAGLPAQRLAVRPNGLADPGPVPEGPRAGLLYVGRLSEEKGVRVLAEAAALAGVPVRVLGDGPLASQLEGSGPVALLGRQPPEVVRSEMGRAAAVLVPSINYEGQPTAVVEAAALGTPAVASRIGGLPEMVRGEETGLLVEPGNPAALAAAMNRIASDPAGARRMGRAARAVFEERWREDVTTAALLSVYADAVAERRGEEIVP